MAAGVELGAGALEPFRAALAAHAGAALALEDLRVVERVDAVVPGGKLGLDLAEEIERLRPFGMGNPSPPCWSRRRASARWRPWGRGASTLASRWSPRAAPARAGWPFAPRPGISLPRRRTATTSRCAWRATAGTAWSSPAWCCARFVPPARASSACWARSGPSGNAPPARGRFSSPPGPPGPGPPPLDRRGEGFAGVAGDLFSSGESVLVAVADVSRRRAGLESLVAGLAEGPMPVASWELLAAEPSLLEEFDHLVALDPPPQGAADPLLRRYPRAHMAWGPAEAEFALLIWRAQLDLRPALTEVYRALRALPPARRPSGPRMRCRGGGRHPRTRGAAACCCRCSASSAWSRWAARGPAGCSSHTRPTWSGPRSTAASRRGSRRSSACWRREAPAPAGRRSVRQPERHWSPLAISRPTPLVRADIHMCSTAPLARSSMLPPLRLPRSWGAHAGRLSRAGPQSCAHWLSWRCGVALTQRLRAEPDRRGQGPSRRAAGRSFARWRSGHGAPRAPVAGAGDDRDIIAPAAPRRRAARVERGRRGGRRSAGPAAAAGRSCCVPQPQLAFEARD